MVQISQTAYANAGYSFEQRLARWLLMSHDRLGRDAMPITHDSLSIMLGTRRPGITLAVQMLESIGVIKAKRGSHHDAGSQKLEKIAGQSCGFAEEVYANVFQSSHQRVRK